MAFCYCSGVAGSAGPGSTAGPQPEGGGSGAVGHLPSRKVQRLCQVGLLLLISKNV